jgi:hypothetical protein
MLDINERQWQKIVLGMMALFSWRTAHFDASVRVVGKERRFVGDVGSKGFPDIVAVRRDRILFVELKSQKGRFQDGQKEWLHDLANAGAEVYTWRPSDYDDMQEVLK